MALTNLAVFGGAFFTPILVGKITETIGWSWTFYFVAIFCGVCLPLVFFFVPETAYRRSSHLNIDMASSEYIGLCDKSAETGQGRGGSRNDEHVIEDFEVPSSSSNGIAEKSGAAGGSHQTAGHDLGSSTPQTGYRKSLLPFSGRKTDESFWKLLIRPFPLFAHPAILWAALIQGAMIGWTVFIGIILAAIFLGPPLFWSEVETGYAYTGAFVGAVLGFLVAGALSDWSARFLTRINGGIYEPEFRIVLVIPQLLFGCTGLYGFGITSATIDNYSWFWPVFFFGLEVMGMVIGAVASALYIVDAHRRFCPLTYSIGY
jgi:MFS family permease